MKMNVLLQKHGAKHIYKVPEGLRELCTDIAREVLRSQPRNIYCFIADYVEALLITRENAKVAVKVVNNILLESQAIVGILHRSGLSLEQIARVAPKIQTAFRAYLDAVDMRAAQVCDDAICDKKSKVSLQSILQATGVPLEQAEKHATIIQAAFRGHYERMLLNESRGIIQWQRAATRTLEILRKAGASQAEASKAAILIQATYRGYYARRNLKIKMAMQQEEEKRSEVDMIEPREAVQAVAWLDMMYEESGLTPMRANEAASIIQKTYRRYREKKSDINSPVKSVMAEEVAWLDTTNKESELTRMRENEAASIIQKAYRQYRKKRSNSNPPLESTRSAVGEEVAWSRLDTMHKKSGLTSMRANETASIIQKAYRQYREKRNDFNPPIESTRSLVAEAILKNLHQKIFDEVIARADIPTEFGNQEDLTKAGKELQRVFKDQLIRARLAEEEYDDEEFIHIEESNELFKKLVNRVYSIDMAKDWQEDREIEIESKRDEETDADQDDPINMEAVGERCEKRNETTSVRRAQRAQQAKSCLRRLPNAGDTMVFNAYAYVIPLTCRTSVVSLKFPRTKTNSLARVLQNELKVNCPAYITLI